MNRWIVAPLLAVVAALIHTQLFFSDWGERVEPLALDVWFNIRGEIDPPEDVILIAMDEVSYEELEIPMDKAWPRAVHARLLQRLAAAGTRRVAFDVLFLGESADLEADKALAEGFAALPSVIGADSGTSVGAIRIEELYLPHDPFLEAIETPALVGSPEDAGYVRRFKTKRTGRSRDYPSLAEAGAGVDHSVRDGLPGERDFIYYYGPAGTIPTFSYFEVLDPELVEDELLKDKVAYVGLMLRTELGPAQKDSFLTPFWERGRIFGVEIHATAAANLLTKNWVKRLDGWVEGLVLGVLAFVITGLFFLIRPQWAVIVLIVSVVGMACTSFSAFLSGYFLPGVVLCSTVLPIMYLLSTLYFYFVSQRTQKQTQKAFELYLSPQMAREVGKNPKALGLGGENVYATAIFTDIVGFTKITEGMLAEKVTHMLNSYFNEVMDVVFEYEGTLIKFIGDSIFAIWGAPIKIGDHAEKGVQTAISVDKAVAQFNASKEFPELQTRIGVHTGPMVVGNLGSDRRFDYTAIGDSVNLASRVEGLNKYFGTSLLITDTTKKDMLSDIQTYQMGLVSVVGKDEVVGVHTIFRDPLPKPAGEKWETAIYEFRARNWEAAREVFTGLSSAEPRLRTAADLYLEQITLHLENEPDKDWQGEIVFSTK